MSEGLGERERRIEKNRLHTGRLDEEQIWRGSLCSNTSSVRVLSLPGRRDRNNHRLLYMHPCSHSITKGKSNGWIAVDTVDSSDDNS